MVNWGLVSRTRAAELLTWFESNRTDDSKKRGVDSPPAMYGIAMGNKGADAAIAGAVWMDEAVDSDGDSSLSMGEATGIPIACGAKLLSEGRIKGAGVFSPEAGHINAREFLIEVFSQLQKMGKLSSSALEDNIRISRSL